MLKIQELKFTIITIVYNNKYLIENTILSVINQNYKNFEYIIVDGGSNDGTVEIIKKYADQINILLSEEDDGIYYAMNKGLSLASGDWICMMNSGDVFYDNDVLSKINSMDLLNIDIVIGSAIAKSSWGSVQLSPPKDGRLWKGFCHQAVFESKRFRNISYNTKYMFAADFDRMYYFYLIDANLKIIDTPFAIVDWSPNGHTAKNYLKSLIENFISVISRPSLRLDKFIYPLLYRSFILIKALIGRIVLKTSKHLYFLLKKFTK